MTLSPHSSQFTIGSQQMVGGLQIPGVSSSLIGGPVGGYGRGFGIRGDSGVGARADEGGFLEDDLGFEVAADGTLHFSDPPAPAPRQPAGPSGWVDRTDLGSVSSRVGHEHEDRQLDHQIVSTYRTSSKISLTLSQFGQPDDDGFMPLQDDYALGTDLEAFPPRDAQVQQQTTSETADAPMRKRARAAPKIIAPDATLELRNGDLARWNTDYVANMQEVIKHKQASRIATIAKKNAEHWVLGTGCLSGLSQGSLSTLSQADRLIPRPLEMFSGAKLLEALTGIKLLPGGEKRGRGDEDAEGNLRKRSRGLEPSSDELARGGFDDDGYMPMMGDEYTGIEQGREAPTPLDDRHLSSAFPWNQSAGSRRPTSVFGSASLAGAGAQPGLVSRRGSRLQTASPLIGRGLQALPSAGLDELQQQGLYSDELGAAGDIAMTGPDDFELFGAAAQVDTQTAAQSQWQRAALDGESVNFLAFVQAGVEEADQLREQAGPGDEEDDALKLSLIHI